MTITLPAALDQFVRDKVTAGLYANESEVIGEALHEQAAAGFAQFETGEFGDLTRDELVAHLAQRRLCA